VCCKCRSVRYDVSGSRRGFDNDCSSASPLENRSASSQPLHESSDSFSSSITAALISGLCRLTWSLSSSLLRWLSILHSECFHISPADSIPFYTTSTASLLLALPQLLALSSLLAHSRLSVLRSSTRLTSLMIQLLQYLSNDLPYTLQSLHIIFRLGIIFVQGLHMYSDWC